MKNASVTDMGIGMEDGPGSGKRMQDTVLLNVRSSSYTNEADVASQYRARTDITSRVDADIPDQHSKGMDKGFRVHSRFLIFKLIPRHSNNSSAA